MWFNARMNCDDCTVVYSIILYYIVLHCTLYNTPKLQSRNIHNRTEVVKIFTLKMPTLIINEYILTRFKEEHGDRKWDIHNQKGHSERSQWPIMDLQYQRLTSQIRDCYREENSFFELFLKNKSLTKLFKVSSIITPSVPRES